MLTRLPCLLAAASTLGGLTLNAQIILQNDFSSVDAGNYSGKTGVPFGEETLLGNATFDGNVEVIPSGGVGDSAYLQAIEPRGIRSRSTAQLGTTIFSFDFLATQDSNNNDRGGLLAGWDLNPDNGDLHNADDAELQGRAFVGFKYENNGTSDTSDDFFIVGSATEMVGYRIEGFNDNSVTFAAPAIAAWYSMSFALTFNSASNEWTVESLSIFDDTSTLLVNVPSVSFTLTSKQLANGESNLMGESVAYASLALWGNRNGIDGIDNILIEQSALGTVPEPAAFAFFLGLGSTLMILRRRRNR